MPSPTELARIALNAYLSKDVQQIVKSAVDYDLSRAQHRYEDMADDMIGLTDAFEELQRDCEARIEDAAATHADMVAE
jgi:tRNA A-37 threonylcarbamoyl transferase component Bud32